MKYRVLRNCFGFQNRYWTRDEIVDINPVLNPPEHFLPLEEVKKPAEVPSSTAKPKKRLK